MKLILALAAFSVALLSGCGTTVQTRDVVYKEKPIAVQLDKKHYQISKHPVPPNTREEMTAMTPEEVIVSQSLYITALRGYIKSLIVQIKDAEKASNEMTNRIEKEVPRGQ